jgi:hypothetical protein
MDRNDFNALDIPEDNREIAIHLRVIRLSIADLTKRVSDLEDSVQQRSTKFQDNLFSGLILPLVGGMLLFLLTKALG